MRVSLDTNIWIFGIVGASQHCETILFNLNQFEIIIPNQIRVELERNLSADDMKQFYQFVLRFGVKIDFTTVPPNYIASFNEKGLKKGDAEIGAFCEWQQVEIIVSDNRDFLRGLAAGHSFEVLSPEEFCARFHL